MKRICISTIVGCVAAVVVFLALRGHSKGVNVFSTVSPVGSSSDRPQVYLMWENPPNVKGGDRIKNAVRLVVRDGEAFSGDTHIPRQKIREILDGLVQKESVESVIVFPERTTRWGEIMSVVDECRKSKVRFVYLNQF